MAPAKPALEQSVTLAREGRRMSLLGTAVLAIWNDVAAGGDDEFNHWHTNEHVPERVGVPGFLRGRRYLAVSGSPKYFTLYETESLDTLARGPYIERLNNPTPWTSRALPLFRNNNRSACRVTVSLGQGVGGSLATVRLGPLDGREAELRGWLTEKALPAVAGHPCVVGAHFCEADVSATGVPTQERTLRAQDDEVARWIVLVETGGTEPADAACRAFLGRDELARHGAAPDAASGLYRLLYCLSK
jgi:hypothetical protein